MKNQSRLIRKMVTDIGVYISTPFSYCIYVLPTEAKSFNFKDKFQKFLNNCSNLNAFMTEAGDKKKRFWFVGMPSDTNSGWLTYLFSQIKRSTYNCGLIMGEFATLSSLMAKTIKL